VTSEDAGVWESQVEVDAVLSETGATMDKVRRWRRQGLLPKEIDWRPEAYHGSTVRYPKGTCTQLRAAAALFKKRNRVNYVGLRLWRLGFAVDDKYWRPRLRRAGWVADKAARILPGLIDRFDRSSSANTFSEATADKLSQAATSFYRESRAELESIVCQRSFRPWRKSAEATLSVSGTWSRARRR
jgi:hypothetical protein